MEKLKKIIVIVGPTASGKTSLSIRIAEQYNGEIISADSRQVYKGLDIGTGKVTNDEMVGIPHHLIDVADPKDTYSVTKFVEEADKAILDITDRKKLPIVVGGTFLYVDTLLGKMNAVEVPPNEALRTELELLPLPDLHKKLETLDPNRYESIDLYNKRRVIRSIEIATAVGEVPESVPVKRYDALVIGIDISKEELHNKIHTRLEERLEAGMIDEVKNLYKNGLSYERMEDLGLEYRYIARYLKDELTYEEMVTTLETKICQYAKRQMTWLKKDSEIVWVESNELERVDDLVEKFLSN